MKIDILAKQQAIRFYEKLEDEIRFLKEILVVNIGGAINNIRSKFDTNINSLYNSRNHRTDTKLVDEAIKDGKDLFKIQEIERQIKPATNEGPTILQNSIADTFQEILDLENTMASIHRTDEFESEIKSEILKIGRRNFAEVIDQVSIWTALAIAANSYPKKKEDIVQILDMRFKELVSLCAPFWQIEEDFRALSKDVEPINIISYDQDTFDSFKETHTYSRRDLRIPDSREETAEILDLDKRAYIASNKELKFMRIEGGVPLDFITPVKYCESAFLEGFKHHNPPNLADKRYEDIAEYFGIPTWRVKVVNPGNMVKGCIHFSLQKNWVFIMPFEEKNLAFHEPIKFGLSTR